MIETIVLVILIFLLILTFFGDLLQYQTRVAVSIFGYPNLSTHLVSLSMLINRVGAAGSLLLIGYLIDTGITFERLLEVYWLCSVVITFLYFLIVKFSNFSFKLLKFFIKGYYKIEIKDTLIFDTIDNKKEVSIDIIIVFFISLCGFFLPSVSAALYPEFRATLLQTGFMLNSFATIYFALKIEKSLALTLNNGNRNEKLKVYLSFMYARVYGALMTVVLFSFILIIVKFY